nr:Zinc finger, CCHC-type [Ipomoea batatas]GMC55423.1 Zinc finger, CCHC-type [Ipomoea batatas]
MIIYRSCCSLPKIDLLVPSNAPNSDNTVCITTEKSAPVGTPAQTGAEYHLIGISFRSHFTLLLKINLEVHHNALALQIPDLNARLCGSTEPGRPKLAVGEIPDFHGAVPRRRHDGGLQSIRAETHTRYPFRVPVLVLNRVLALAQGVPQLDGAVTGSGDDLAVVDGECHGEDVLGVADEAAGGGAGLKVPEAELGVPGAGEGELAVRGEDDVLDKMGMAGEAAAWDAKLRAVLCERPDYDGFVAGGGDDKVSVVDWSGDCRHPIGVSLHCSAEN